VIEAILTYLGGLIGVSPAATVVVLGLMVSIANLVGKAIPDEATGILGVIRRVAKVIGLYVPNRTTA
jgi:hypothetical protein